MDFKLGYIPDPVARPDKPDWDAAPFLSSVLEIPDSASLKKNVISVLNQGGIGSCVANAGMQAIRMRQVEQGIEAPPLGSRLWGYWLARSYHGMEEWDTGTHIRSFFRAMNKFGFLAEQDYKYKYDTWMYAKAPPPLSYRRAFDQRDPTHYYRIFETGEERLEQIRKAIAAGHPVVFGTSLTKDFTLINEHRDPIERPRPGDSIIGGHAMTIVGYNKEFEIVNSWGEGWGNDGYGIMSGDYLAWDQTRDLWVVAKAPTFSQEA